VSELVSEILLRAAKVLAATIVGAILYVIATGPFGEPGSASLALLAFVAGAAVVLLAESSPI
jgi:CRISPR/Cas system-associated protein Csm6